MARFNLNDRPVPSGSCEERLAPRIMDTKLNARIGGVPGALCGKPASRVVCPNPMLLPAAGPLGCPRALKEPQP